MMYDATIIRGTPEISVERYLQLIAPFTRMSKQVFVVIKTNKDNIEAALNTIQTLLEHPSIRTKKDSAIIVPSDYEDISPIIEDIYNSFDKPRIRMCFVNVNDNYLEDFPEKRTCEILGIKVINESISKR